MKPLSTYGMPEPEWTLRPRDILMMIDDGCHSASAWLAAASTCKTIRYCSFNINILTNSLSVDGLSTCMLESPRSILSKIDQAHTGNVLCANMVRTGCCALAGDRPVPFVHPMCGT